MYIASQLATAFKIRPSFLSFVWVKREGNRRKKGRKEKGERKRKIESDTRVRKDIGKDKRQ